MQDVLGLGTAQLPECPGRTWFEALVEGWHDQGMMRQHMEGLHELELARAARPPVVELSIGTPTGPLQFRADPEAGTVSFRVSQPTYEQPAPWLPKMLPAPVEATMELEPPTEVIELPELVSEP